MAEKLRIPRHLPIRQILNFSLIIQIVSTGCHHIKILTYFTKNKMQPLEYIILDIPIPNISPHPSFRDDHVEMEPFHGEAFNVDTDMVHKIIIKLCDGNDTLNANLQSLMMCQDGSM